jgi:hypothetical protein
LPPAAQLETAAFFAQLHGCTRRLLSRGHPELAAAFRSFSFGVAASKAALESVGSLQAAGQPSAFRERLHSRFSFLFFFLRVAASKATLESVGSSDFG